MVEFVQNEISMKVVLGILNNILKTFSMSIYIYSVTISGKPHVFSQEYLAFVERMKEQCRLDEAQLNTTTPTAAVSVAGVPIESTPKAKLSIIKAEPITPIIGLSTIHEVGDDTLVEAAEVAEAAEACMLDGKWSPNIGYIKKFMNVKRKILFEKSDVEKKRIKRNLLLEFLLDDKDC